MKYQPDTTKSIAAIALSLVVLLSVVTTGAVAGTSVALAADDPAVDGASTPAAEEPAESSAEGPAGAPSDEERAPTPEEPADSPTEAPAGEEPTSAPEEPADSSTEEPTEAPADSPTEGPAEAQDTEEPAGSPIEEPTEEPVEEELAPATEESAKVPTEDPPAPSTEEPAEPPAEEASVTEKPADSSIEEPTEAPVEEEPAPAQEEPADSSTEEPTKAPIDGKSAPATEEPAEPEPPVEEGSAPAIEKPSTTTEESAVTTMTATASAEPADDFEYSDLRVAPTEAAVDEPVTITVSVLNNGSAEGTFAAPLFVDGVRVDAASEAFAPGEERDVSYEWAFGEPGIYDVTVGELDPVAVNVTDGAGDGANETDESGDGTNGSVDASYANLSVSPSTVRINGTVLATATVSNPGNETADFVAELLVDGTAVDQRTGSLAPNASVEVEFSWSPGAVGTYEVGIGDLPARIVTVEAAEEPVSHEIDDCTTITEPGVYRLADDLTLDAATCLVVLASDVVVDGDGHTLDGVSGAAEGPRTEKFGLYVAPVAPGASADDAANVSNVTVRDLTVTGWGHGIHLSNADDVSVERVTARGNRVGLYAESVAGLVVRDSTVESSTRHGVRLKRSADVELLDNAFVDQGFRGVFAAGSSVVTIAGNTFDGDLVGLRFKSGTDATIRDNAFAVDGVGVDVMMSGVVDVRGNDVSAGDVGVLVQGTDAGSDSHGQYGHTDEDAGGPDDGHTDGDHTEDDHTDDGHTDGSHTEDDHTDDSHTDDDHADSGGHAARGPVEVSGNRIADADVGVRLEGGSNVTLADNVFENLGRWTVYAGNGSSVEPTSQVTLAGTPVSAHGRDVAITTPGSAPPDPAGYASVGRYVEVSTTAPDGWVELAVPYARGHLPAGVEETDLQLLVHDGSDWRPAELAVWSNADGAWTLTGTDAVDTASRMVSANVTEPGVVGLFAGPTADPSVAPRVENATLHPTVVGIGGTATVSADVHNDDGVAVSTVVDLVVDGDVVESKAVRPVPGASERVTFDLSQTSAGSYDVAVGGDPAGTLSVFDPVRADGLWIDVGSIYAGDAGHGWAAAGSEVESRVEVAPGSDGGAEARVTAQAGVPSSLDFGWLAPEPATGVRLDSMQVTTNRDMVYELRARTGLGGDPAQPAFDARFGEPIEYVEFDHSFEDAAIEDGRIGFAVARERVDDPAQIALYRHHDGAWTRLDTRHVRATATEYVYEASTPGFSVFAVAAERPASPEVAVDVLATDRYAVGGPIPITAAVHNPYRAPMAFTVHLRVDGAVVASEQVTVGPHGAERVAFEYVPDEAGTDALSLADVDVGTVTVEHRDASGSRVTEQKATSGPGTSGSDGPAGLPVAVVLAALIGVLLAVAALAVRRWR